MQIGIVGKTNTGKSSFFKAATLVDVEISNRTFCTIKPNVGVGYVTTKCPCKELNVKCNPKNSKCIDGTRLIPVKLLDVAGLVPGAHEGRGLGNQFLNDLVPANVLIHVIDISGTTDEEGRLTSGYDPANDIKFLFEEIDLWFESVIKRNLEKIRDKKRAIEVLSGLGIKSVHIEKVLENTSFEKIDEFARELRKISKPIVIAANKIDLPESRKNFDRIKKQFPDLEIIPTCAEAEIALREAAKSGIIKYIPGDSKFDILKPDKLNENQMHALEFIKEKILDVYGNTGVQQSINSAVFKKLGYIVVYPVENEHKFSDKKGNILPDAYLMPPRSTAKDLAYKIHEDIGKRFLYAVDARTKKRIGSDYELKNGDIIKIVSTAK